jgi:hypothetical protein
MTKAIDREPPVSVGWLRSCTTDVPNLILDNIDAFSDCEYRVITCISRATFGWHKGADWLTRSEIARRIGRTRQSVTIAVKSLVDRHLLIVRSASGELLDSPEARQRVGREHGHILFSLNTLEQVDVRSNLPLTEPNVKIPGLADNLSSGEITPPEGWADNLPRLSRLPAPTKEIPVCSSEVDLSKKTVSETESQNLKLLTIFLRNLVRSLPLSQKARTAADQLETSNRTLSPKDRVTLLSEILFDDLENYDEAWTLRSDIWKQIGQLCANTHYDVQFLSWAFGTMKRIPVEGGNRVTLFGPVGARWHTWCEKINDYRSELIDTVPDIVTSPGPELEGRGSMLSIDELAAEYENLAPAS